MKIEIKYIKKGKKGKDGNPEKFKTRHHEIYLHRDIIYFRELGDDTYYWDYNCRPTEESLGHALNALKQEILMRLGVRTEVTKKDNTELDHK